jgi:molybdenum cofactor guanylyltransferase
MPVERTGVLGLLLAGGQGRRMGGGDKCQRSIGNQTLLAHAIQRAAPQVDALLINANGDPDRFSASGLPVAADVVEGHAGPLAGILTGIEWARETMPACAWVASIATDTPFFPLDLVARLLDAVHAKSARIGCAASSGRTHPVFGLWPIALASDLRHAVCAEGMRKIDTWTARYPVAVVEFADQPFDPFFNVNAPADLDQAEKMLAAMPSRPR